MNAKPAKVISTISATNSWALAYHAAGAARGTDLTHVFKYPSTALPPGFS